MSHFLPNIQMMIQAIFFIFIIYYFLPSEQLKEIKKLTSKESKVKIPGQLAIIAAINHLIVSVEQMNVPVKQMNVPAKHLHAVAAKSIKTTSAFN